MSHKFVTLLCYWDGKNCDGPEGVVYNKCPSKAIKVHCGMKFDELIDRIHRATSMNKQQHHIKVICRYPSVGIGKVIKYIPLPIKDNDDVDVMFDVLNLHHEVSNIELYLEVEDNGPKEHRRMASRTQESFILDDEEEERNSERSLPTTTHVDVIFDMTQNEDFNRMSQIAVVNNSMRSEFDLDNEVDEDDMLEDDGLEDEEAEEIHNHKETRAPTRDENEAPPQKEVPPVFTSFEGINMTTDGNWTVSYSKSITDLNQELGKD